MHYADDPHPFAQIAQDRDLVVIDLPMKNSAQFVSQCVRSLLAKSHESVLLGINQAVLAKMGCDLRDSGSVGERFSAVIGRRLVCRGTYFRYRYPEVCHWIWLTPGS
ncbi:MAG: hypothetical protein EPO08_11965 [Rhodospirillaceae bacterium]|nr:MAG: hypothetical protein EPO08_11965 [Rhodospirillaceae bacterium]